MYADYGQSNYGTMDAEAIDPLPLPENAPEQIDEVCLSLDIHLVCFDQMKIVFITLQIQCFTFVLNYDFDRSMQEQRREEKNRKS